jgi:hypothetical protein
MWKVVRRANSIKVFRGLPRSLEQMLSLYPNFTLHCTPLCRPPNIDIKISPCAALPRFSAWTWGCNWMQCDPSTYIAAAPLISTFFTSECVTSSPTHLYQKDEWALLGDLHNRKLSSVSLPVKCSVLHYPPTFSSRSLALSLRQFYYDYYTIILILWHVKPLAVLL